MELCGINTFKKCSEANGKRCSSENRIQSEGEAEGKNCTEAQSSVGRLAIAPITKKVCARERHVWHSQVRETYAAALSGIENWCSTGNSTALQLGMGYYPKGRMIARNSKCTDAFCCPGLYGIGPRGADLHSTEYSIYLNIGALSKVVVLVTVCYIEYNRIILVETCVSFSMFFRTLYCSMRELPCRSKSDVL